MTAAIAARSPGRYRLFINCCGTPFTSLPPALQTAVGLVQAPSVHLLGTNDALLSEAKLLSQLGQMSLFGASSLPAYHRNLPPLSRPR